MTTAQEVLEIFKSMRQAERNSADAYAGPGKSFPLFSSGAHLHAAWMLAGHAADPSAVRSRIKSFAAKHGLTHLLPDSAFDEDSGSSGSSGSGKSSSAKKAAGVASYADGGDHGQDDGVSRFSGHAPRPSDSRSGRLLELAYEQAESSLDDSARHGVIDFAQREGLSHLLPPSAHGYMHQHAIPHGHPGDEHDGSPTLHDHPVQKAVNVVTKTVSIEKAWDGEDGDTIIEGWVSPEAQDSECDIVPPECFEGCLDEFMARKAPLSSDHNLSSYPVGHGQRLALVRDGKVFKSAVHPDDPAEFEHFPGTGTGMYGRYRITEPTAGNAVKKGNVGGFSWIGNLREYAPLPGGGRRFIKVDPLRENTIAAYPVNGKAVLTAVKAFEAELEAAQQGDYPLMDKLDELLRGAALAVEREERERQAQVAASAGSVSKADIEGLLASFKSDILSAVEQKVQKAQPEPAVVEREAGAGRRGVESGAGASAPQMSDPRDSDPSSYIIKKAREVYASKDEDADLSQEDKELAWGITLFGMSEGMSY